VAGELLDRLCEGAYRSRKKRSRANGVLLWLVGLTPGVLNVVQHSPLGQTLGRERMFFNLEQAVDKSQSLPSGVSGSVPI
jgi:SulP family sulfate permease